MNSKFIVNDEIKFRRTGDVLIAYSQKDSSMFEFNESGSFVFEMISNGKTYDGILKAVCNEFDTTIQDSREDIDSIIERLLGLGVILPG